MRVLIYNDITEDFEDARLRREEARGDSVQAMQRIAAEGKAEMIHKYQEMSIEPDSVREDKRFTEDHVQELHRQAEEQKKKRMEEFGKGVSSDIQTGLH